MNAIKNNRVVYTALFGNYDTLLDPKFKSEGVDYVCFTDQKNLKSKIWKIVIVYRTLLSPALENRKYKILAHKYLSKFSQSIYVDANVGLKGDLNHLFDRYLEKSSFSIPKHQFRNCIYQEIDECYRTGKIQIDKKNELVHRYKSMGVPEKNGLSENNILIRIHNRPEVIALMEEWFYAVKNDCPRDQLSLMPLLWRDPLNYSYIDISTKVPNDYFYYNPHISVGKTRTSIKKLVISIMLRRGNNYCFYFLSKILDILRVFSKNVGK